MTNKRGRPIIAKNPLCPTPKEIKNLRIKHGLSQKDAASLCGVGTRTWQRFEAGTNGMLPALWNSWKKAAAEPLETMSPPHPSAFEIKEARNASGFTIKKAAAIANTDVKTWSNWETGRAIMHPYIWEDWLRLVRAFQMD